MIALLSEIRQWLLLWVGLGICIGVVSAFYAPWQMALLLAVGTIIGALVLQVFWSVFFFVAVRPDREPDEMGTLLRNYFEKRRKDLE